MGDSDFLRPHHLCRRHQSQSENRRADVEAMLAKSRATMETPASSPPSKPVEPTPPAPAVSEIPKVAEPPKISEVPKVIEPPTTVKATVSDGGRAQAPPRDLGRGGAQHQAVQKRIKEAAEAVGFRSVIEKPVLDGQGSVDLWLERTGQTIACEISISTTIDHEVGNVAKCLKAGFSKVAVICLDEERLRKIETAVSGSLGSELAVRVEYFQPDPFITHLKQLKHSASPPTETKYGGYKIKRSVPKLSLQEQKQKEDIVHRAMRETMQKRFL